MGGPDKLTDAERAAAIAAFEKLGICTQLAEAAAGLGWKAPSHIQEQAIPHLLAGQDVIGLAQTGSGKTGAFSLPILQALMDKPQEHFALILSPTRELAIQIAEQVEALGSGIGVKSCVLVGGIDMMAQAIALAKRPHVLVGTPGRVVDHLSNTKGFSLKQLKHLVLDEADKLLDMDFEQEIDQILKVIPRERRTQLFSATMTNKVQKLQRACLDKPVKIEVAHKYSTVDTLRQQYVFIPAKYKDCYLAYVINELSGSTFMIFTRTCESTRRIALLLRNLGFGAVPIHGHMSQPKRLGALNKFKSGERNILVATDVASRGLDIPSVDVVINFDVPQNSKDYVHRVGRTARAGRSGRSVTIVTQYDVELFQKIEHLTGVKMEQFQAEREEVLLLLERVSDAQRLATMQMKEAVARYYDGVLRPDDETADAGPGGCRAAVLRPAAAGPGGAGEEAGGGAGPERCGHPDPSRAGVLLRRAMNERDLYLQLSHYYRLLHVEGAARRHHCRLRAADPKSGVSLDDVRAKVPESLARTLGAAAEALDGLRRRSHWHWVDLGKLFGSLAAPAAAAAAGGAAAGGKGSRQGTAGVGAGMGMGGGVGAVNLGAVRGVVV